MDQILKKTIIGTYKGFINEKEKEKFLTYLKIFFVARSLKTTRKNCTSPNNGTIKKYFFTN